MSEEQNTWTFKAEDIFEDIEGDKENVNMNIPPEVMEKMGWKEGDTLRILLGDQGTVIIEKAELPKETNG
jgi:formylmethanofuran dehydrogenase subunit D